MQFFKDSSETELSVLAALMMAYSDNTTSLWNQSLAGGGAAVNALLEQYGLKDTRVNLPHAGTRGEPESVRLGADHPARNEPAAAEDPEG